MVLMDYTNPSGAETREVQDRIHAGRAVRAVVVTRSYAAERRGLWQALTQPKRLSLWFMPVTGRLARGGRYSFEGRAKGSILRCDAPEVLEVTWELEGHVSWVHVRLAPQEGQTRLTLAHLVPREPVNEANWKEFGPSAGGVGWDLSLFALDLHLASGGQAIDDERHEAWLTSEAGKSFLRTCVDLWREAHVRAGEKPEVAAAMARRTAAFYAG